MNAAPRMLTIAQVAARLNVSRMTLYRWRGQKGQLQPVELRGRGRRPMVRYREADVERWERQLPPVKRPRRTG